MPESNGERFFLIHEWLKWVTLTPSSRVAFGPFTLMIGFDSQEDGNGTRRRVSKGLNERGKKC